MTSAQHRKAATSARPLVKDEIQGVLSFLTLRELPHAQRVCSLWQTALLSARLANHPRPPDPHRCDNSGDADTGGSLSWTVKETDQWNASLGSLLTSSLARQHLCELHFRMRGGRAVECDGFRLQQICTALPSLRTLAVVLANPCDFVRETRLFSAELRELSITPPHQSTAEAVASLLSLVGAQCPLLQKFELPYLRMEPTDTVQIDWSSLEHLQHLTHLSAPHDKPLLEAVAPSLLLVTRHLPLLREVSFGRDLVPTFLESWTQGLQSGELANLCVFDLTFSTPHAGHIPFLLRFKHSLTTLKTGYIEGNAWHTLSFLEHFEQLQELHLQFYESCIGPRQIANTLTHSSCRSIHTLGLNYSQLTHEDLALFLPHLPRLRSLYICAYGVTSLVVFSSRECTHLAQTLEHLWLNLNGYGYGCVGPRSEMDHLLALQALRTLKIEEDSFEEPLRTMTSDTRKKFTPPTRHLPELRRFVISVP